MGKAQKIEETPEVAPVAASGTPGKFVYVGDRFPYGPHRGFTPESVAGGLGITNEDDRKAFLDNLKAW